MEQALGQFNRVSVQTKSPRGYAGIFCLAQPQHLKGPCLSIGKMEQAI